MYVSEHQWVGPRGGPAEPIAVNQFPDNFRETAIFGPYLPVEYEISQIVAKVCHFFMSVDITGLNLLKD